MDHIFTKKSLFLFIICLAGLKANAQSVAGTITGATIVCPNMSNNGFLGLSGDTGTSFIWQLSIDNGATWTTTSTVIDQYSYFNITQTTCYRAIVQNGAFPPDTTDIMACIDLYPPSVGGTISGAGTFCVVAPSDTLTLTGNTGNPLYWEYSTDGGTTWTNVANTLTTLVYPNITQNTIYQVVVQSGPGCPKDSSQTSFVIDAVTVPGTVSSSSTVCYGANADTLNLSGNVGNILNWLSSTDNGTTWTSIANTTTAQNYLGLVQNTWYAAVVQNGVCSMDTSSIAVITLWAPTPVNAGNDTSIVQGQSFTLSGTGTGNPIWLPSAGLSNDTIFTPIATPTITTNYVLAVTDANGCVNTDAVLITVTLEQFGGMISNLFTPNGDGINDTWYIEGIMFFPDNEVFVYNIYGNEVYHKKNYINDWKGTYNNSELPDGTYYYVLRFDERPAVLKGSIDILRNK